MTKPIVISRQGGIKQYQYVDSYEIADAQLDQISAGYNPLGASGTQGCANCNWFLAPGRCVVVAGEISPTGLSDLWRAKESDLPAPILVQIVDAPAANGATSADKAVTVSNEPKRALDDPDSGKHQSMVDRIMSAVKSAVLGSSNGSEDPAAAPTPVLAARQFTLVKQKDGRLRFMAAWSNNFTDREGEIFPEYAHKEYIDWADRNQQYPELWLWHTKGTKYGQVDWVDYTDGFVFASGLIDVGFEPLAEALAKEDCGVSHGFAGLQRGKEIVQYRPFEISTLPRSNAAVWTTSFNIIEGAAEMAFTQQKKDWLKQHGLSDEQITVAEKQATDLSASLKSLGVAWKDSDVAEETAPAAPAAAAVPAAPVVDSKSAGVQEQVLASLERNTNALVALAGVVQAIDGRVKAVEQTDDAKIAAALTARTATPPTAASADTTNVVDVKQTNQDKEFFDKNFLASLGVGPAVATAG